jgi:hypothetical protein
MLPPLRLARAGGAVGLVEQGAQLGSVHRG